MRSLAPEVLQTAKVQRWSPDDLLRTLVDASQIDDLAPGVEEIDDSTPELRWVSMSSHCCLLRWTAA